jgi:hypothetical protein
MCGTDRVRRSLWLVVLAVGCGTGSSLSSGHDGGSPDGESGDASTPIDAEDATMMQSDGAAGGDTSSIPLADAGGRGDGPSALEEASDGNVVVEDAGGDAGSVRVRLAQMIYDSAYDLCLVEPDGGRVGPVFGSMGVDGGLAYGQVSDYVTIDLNEKPELIVYQASRTCAVPGSAGWRGWLNGPAGANVTLVAYYTADVSASSPYRAVAAVDEAMAPSNEANIRAIHTATLSLSNTSWAVAFEIGSSVTFPDVPYASVASPGGGVDSNGYAITAPFTNEYVTLVDAPAASGVTRYSAGPWSTVGGHFYSLYSVGGGSPTPIKLVACDEALPLVNHLVACSFL